MVQITHNACGEASTDNGRRMSVQRHCNASPAPVSLSHLHGLFNNRPPRGQKQGTRHNGDCGMCCRVGGRIQRAKYQLPGPQRARLYEPAATR